MINIGWIDFSADDRRKVKQLLSLIKPEGQLDELGIGYIRDAVSNKLFPGISTIQTRAKYFFIIPYILRDYLSLSSTDKRKIIPLHYLQEKEDVVQDLLREKYSGTSEKGIIGFTMAKGKYVKRKPSEIYWSGLNLFKCIDSNGLSLPTLMQNAQRQNRYSIEALSSEDEPDDATSEETFKILVPYQKNWKDNLDIRLRENEANFFKDRLTDKKNIQLRDTLIFELFEDKNLMQIFRSSNRFQDFAKQVQSMPINPIVKANLEIGHDFYQAMEGSHILYNHLLQKHFFEEKYDDLFLDDFNEWIENLPTEMINFENLNLNLLFSLSGRRNYRQTDLYVRNWWQLVNEFFHSQKQETIHKMETLIKNRERIVKLGKARLQKSPLNNPDVGLGQRIGIQDMNYRFYNVKVIIEDIFNPIENI